MTGDRAGGADAPEPRAASQPKALIPSAMLNEMRRYLAAAKHVGVEPDRFIMAESLVPAFSPTGSRPARFDGVRIEAHKPWAWGWMLYVKTFSALGAPHSKPFNPDTASATPTRSAETTGSVGVADGGAGPQDDAQPPVNSGQPS